LIGLNVASGWLAQFFEESHFEYPTESAEGPATIGFVFPYL